MKITSLLLLLYLFFFSYDVKCQNKEEHSAPLVLQDTTSGYAPLTTATLILKKRGKMKPLLQFHDYLDNLVLLSNVGDSLQISFRNFHVLYNTDKGSAPFIVLPNDRIQVGLDSMGWLVLETGIPTRDAELNLFTSMVKAGKGDFTVSSVYKIMQEKSFAKRDSILEDRVKKEQTFFKEYSANPLLRPEVQSIARQFLLHHEMFEKFRVVSSMGGPEGELKSYYDQLAKYLQSQNRFSYYFPRFRFVAASSLNLGFITASAIKRKDAEWASAKDFETNLTLAKSFFDSSLVEPVQYLLLKNPGNQKLANHKEQLLGYAARYPDTDFTRHLQEELAYRESINKNFAGNQLLGQKDATLPLEELMAKKRGKVLYVDFWASWCVPCLEEMPKSLELQEKYKGQPVEFVYLSVDKSRAAWEKGRQRHPKALQTANSFLLLQEFSSPFARGLRLQAIPRYLLIDKAGRIVNANAPRPSEPDLLEKELDKLLR